MTATTAASPPPRVLDSPSYRWYLAGGILSMTGDQFTLIALPWLVLSMTHDPAMLGLVLGVMGLPRAGFLLFGGVFVDRYSPKRVLMITKYVSTVLLALLAALLVTGSLQLWMVFVLAFALGLATSFSMPAINAMMPSIVPLSQLQQANGIMMSARQFSIFAGPLLAGGLIALSGTTGTVGQVPDAMGIAAAFAFDALSFALSAVTLRRVKMLAPAGMPAAAAPQAPGGIVQAVGAGLRACWQDTSLRSCFIYWGVAVCVLAGPLQVALPVLARHLGSAAAFGTITAAYGAGAFFGSAFGSARPHLRLRTLGTTLLVLDAASAVVFIGVGSVQAVWQAAALLCMSGMIAGFSQLAAFTWVQRRAPKPLLGRVMSVYAAIGLGVAPLSAAIAGPLVKSLPVDIVFPVFGCAMLLLTMVAVFTPVRHIRDLPLAVPGQPPAPASAQVVHLNRRYARDEILGFLRDAERGASVADLCAKHGFTEARFRAWHARLGGLPVEAALRMHRLQSENHRLKYLLGGASLEIDQLRERGGAETDADPAWRSTRRDHTR